MRTATAVVGAAVVSLILLPAAPASAQRWTLITSETLTVIGDESPRTLRDIATQIEQFRSVVGDVFREAGRGPSVPTVVYVFSRNTRLREYLPIIDGKVVSAAGLMSRDGEVSRILLTTETYEASSRIALHEYTHLLTSNTGRRFPVWLNEGLAEYFSTYVMRDGGQVADIGHPLATSVLYLRERWLPLADMIAVSSSLYHESEQRTVFYPQAWALVHYILTEMPNGVATINEYMQHLDAGVAGPAAFAQAFGESIESIERKLRRYVQRDVFQVRRVTLKDKVAANRASAPRTLNAAEADAWLGDLQRAERRGGEARIESAAAREPELAVAQLALGRLRASQQREEEARTALSRAAQLAPEDYLVQWSNAMWRMRMGRFGQDNDTVGALRRMAAMRPDSAEGLVLFATAAMQSPATREEARAALERAITLSPGRLDYRLRYAELLLMSGQTTTVRPLLKVLATATADPATAARAAEHLRALERLDARRADTLAGVEASAATATGPNTPVTISGIGAISESEALLRMRNQRLSFQLRRVEADEGRAFGRLTRVECRPGGEVRFHLTTSEGAIIAAAANLSNVLLIQFRDGKESMLTCGVRTPADPAFVTWRKDRAGQGVAGTALAVEFMPDDFLP